MRALFCEGNRRVRVRREGGWRPVLLERQFGHWTPPISHLPCSLLPGRQGQGATKGVPADSNPNPHRNCAQYPSYHSLLSCSRDGWQWRGPPQAPLPPRNATALYSAMRIDPLDYPGAARVAAEASGDRHEAHQRGQGVAGPCFLIGARSHGSSPVVAAAAPRCGSARGIGYLMDEEEGGEARTCVGPEPGRGLQRRDRQGIGWGVGGCLCVYVFACCARRVGEEEEKRGGTKGRVGGAVVVGSKRGEGRGNANTIGARGA